jgi:hypothetical protein
MGWPGEICLGRGDDGVDAVVSVEIRNRSGLAEMRRQAVARDGHALHQAR